MLLSSKKGGEYMIFQSISSEKDAQALDLLIITFLMLFTVVMFMQFGTPSFNSASKGIQGSGVHLSIFGQ